jgi:hypothetical protein
LEVVINVTIIKYRCVILFVDQETGGDLMLERKFLKRFTRLGLTAYLMFWCMSFTVCASDNPLADLAVPDGLDAAIVASAAEDGEELETLSEVIPGEAGEEALGEEADVLDEDAEADAEEDAEPSDDQVPVDDAEPAEDEEIPSEDAETEEEEIITAEDEVILEDVEEIDEADLQGYYDIDSDEWLETISLYQHEIIVTQKDTQIVQAVYNDYTPKDANINTSRLKWRLLYANGTEIPSDVLSYTYYESFYHMIVVDCSVLTKSMVFFIEVEYQNCMTTGSQYCDANPKDQCRVQYVAEEDEISDDIEIELLQKSLDVELFQHYNNLSVLVKADFEQEDSELLGSEYRGAYYFIRKAEFEDPELREYFSIRALDCDKFTVNTSYKLRSYYSADEINKIVNKSKYSSKIVFTYAKSDGSNGTYTTKDALTINIKRSYPSAKAAKLVINPYIADTDIYLTPSIEGYGVNTNEFGFDSSRPIPAGMECKWVSGEGAKILIHSDLNTSVKSGKIPIRIYASYNIWCLPHDNYFSAEIPYTIKTTLPKIKVIGSKSKISNPFISSESESDVQYFTFNITDDALEDYEVTVPAYEVLDSKNKDASEQLGIEWDKDYDGTYYLYAYPIPSTIPGQTYKIRLYTRNLINGMNTSSSATVLTLKTVSEKDSEKISISAATKGTIDAMKYGTSMNVTITAKNVGIAYTNVKIFKTDGDKGEITDLFRIRDDIDLDKLQVEERDRNSLLRAGLAGKKVLINCTFNYTYYGNGDEVRKQASVTKTVTIKSSNVTPKLSVTKATLNPYADTDFILRYSFPDNPYNYYNVSYDVLVGSEVVDHNPSSYSGYIHIQNETLRKAQGKTIVVKVKALQPAFMPEGVELKEFKNATCKLTVLSAAKAKPQISFAVKGSINNIKAYSYINLTMKVKNINEYGPGTNLKFGRPDYYRIENGVRVSYSDCFFIERIPGSGNNFILYSMADEAVGGARLLEPGTYYYEQSYRYPTDYNEATEEYKWEEAKLTFSFKVTRGSASLTASKKQVELQNNNTRRDTLTYVCKDKSINAISKVEVADANSPFKAYYLGNNKVSIGFKDGKYTEMKNGKPITAAVTKNVKLNIYFLGSSKPNTVTLKVKINP